MGRHSHTGNGRNQSNEGRQHRDQHGRRANGSNDTRSGGRGDSTQDYRGATQAGTEGQAPPYSRSGHVEVDDDRAFDTRRRGEGDSDDDNYDATREHLHDPAPQSFQGTGFFGSGQGVPFQQTEPQVGMGRSVGYGPNPNPGLGFRGRGPKGYQRSDDRLLEEINERLTHDDDVDAHEINVSVEKGEVTLSGTVNSRAEKRRADDIAEDVSGVQHVQNNLRVQKQGG